MKNIKKILAFAFAMSLAVASLSSVTANGIYRNWNFDSEEYQNFLDQYVEFECDSLVNMLDSSKKERYVSTKCYFLPDSQKDYVVVGEEQPCIRALISSDVKPVDVQAVVNEIAPDYSVKWIFGQASMFYDKATGNENFYEIKCPDSKDNAFEQSQRIFEALKDKAEVQVFQFVSGGMCPTYFYTSSESVTDYEYNPETDGDVGTMLTEYVEENCLDFTVFIEELEENSGNTMRCNLVPGESVTREEQWAVSKQIGEKFHLGIWFGTPLSAEAFDSTTIEMADNVDGDANNDGELDIADATLVLQSIGNADKYSLSAQGAYNADVNGSGDVTALDALEIQKIDAGLR